MQQMNQQSQSSYLSESTLVISEAVCALIDWGVLEMLSNAWGNYGTRAYSNERHHAMP